MKKPLLCRLDLHDWEPGYGKVIKDYPIKDLVMKKGLMYKCSKCDLVKVEGFVLVELPHYVEMSQEKGDPTIKISLHLVAPKKESEEILKWLGGEIK